VVVVIGVNMMDIVVIVFVFVVAVVVVMSNNGIILVAPFPKLFQGKYDSSTSGTHSSRVVLKWPIDHNAAYLQ